MSTSKRKASSSATAFAKRSLSGMGVRSSVSVSSTAWSEDVEQCKKKWGMRKKDLEGYAGLAASIQGFKRGVSSSSCRFKLSYEDVDGGSRAVELNVAFDGLTNYPGAYTIALSSEGPAPRGATRIFLRFKKVYDLDVEALVERILHAFQGDDDANGGSAPALEDTDEEEEEVVPDEGEEAFEGSGLRYISASEIAQKPDWTDLKLHFKQAKKMGFRPGLTQVSDFWVISMSVPLKNLPIDPNILMTWDDGLVEAWKADKRIVLLIKTPTYPPNADQMEYFLGLDEKYKPSVEVILNTTLNSARGTGLPPFYLSESLTSHLRDFSRAYKIRTSYALDWDSVDSVALDQDKSIELMSTGVLPKCNSHDKNDPVEMGFERNVPLVAFWWTVRRFIKATKYCLTCGMEVKIPSLRPYVCDNPLCLFKHMNMGLGKALEHTIIHHPTVVDLLLSFAHSAASVAGNRMDLPLQLGIDVPAEFGIPDTTRLDDLDDDAKRRALAWLIQELPNVSTIKEKLEAGESLKSMCKYSGAIGVLRWVVGSCRAYLREARPGEGILATGSEASVGNVRQFTFVVGSPEQETNFKQEIEKAQVIDQRLLQYPTFLAYHGSATQRWHNILRNGLDFQEVANARAYGHGVYFANDNQISMGYCRMSSTAERSNADYPVKSAVAVVELVNVPNTFVSRQPYYVVNNTKQIKPFLLLVNGTGLAEQSTATSAGQLFEHDPLLALKTTYNSQPVRAKIPQKLVRTTYVDDESDDEGDKAIFHPPKPKVVKPAFVPSSEDRFRGLQLMPPPSGNSVGASRLLVKELKSVIAAQEKGELPFYVKPDNDQLYCWILELHEFPDSPLKKDMKARGVKSILAEIRFPETYPQAPPFMRILSPRFLPFQQGGGGNITAGGSICNEILTSTGWNITYTVEMIIRDIMVNMVCATPPARLDTFRWNAAYSMAEAMEAYKRVATVHGWAIPKDFDKMAQ